MDEPLLGTLADALRTRERIVLAPPGKTAAAVLVPLLAIGDEPSLLFTRRASGLPHHQGQVAFPGGRHEPDADGDLATTALREAHEEIGLPPDAVDAVQWPYDYRACPHEVDAIFTVPLRTLRAPDALRRETWDFGGRSVPIDTYPVDGHVIWGATQRITKNLLAVLDTLRA